MTTRMKQALESNLWKFVLHNILHRRIYWPVLAVYFMSFPDSHIQQVGYFMAAGSIAGVILEVPSGYVSDKMGHRNGLLLSSISFLLGSAIFLFGQSFPAFLVGSIFLAGGHAFASGTTTAFIHETLVGLGRDAEYSEVKGRISRTGHLVSAVLLVLIPATAAIDLRLPFVVGLLFDCIDVVTVWSMVAPTRTKIQIEEISTTNFFQVLREARQRKYLPIALFGGFFLAIVMAAGSFRDVYQTFLGINVAFLGALLGISRAFSGLSIPYLTRLRPVLTMKQFYLAETMVTGVLLLAIGFAQQAWLVAALFIVLVGLLWGSRALAEGYVLDYIGSSNFKATLISLEELLKQIFGGGLQLLLGWLIATYAFGGGFTVYALGTSVILLGFWLFLVYQVPTVTPAKS